MQIFQRYIIKSVIFSTMFILTVVMALCFITGMLKELHHLGEGDYGLLQLVIHELLHLPYEVYQLFPMLILLGGVVGLGMLAVNRELLVIRAAGVSMMRIVLAVMMAAFFLIFIATLVGEWLAPQANYLAEKQKSLAQTRGQAVLTWSGIWIHEENNFIHIDQVIGRHHLKGVTRYEFDDKHHLLAAYYAKSLEFHHDHWVANQEVKTHIGQEKTTRQYVDVVPWDLKLPPNLLNIGRVEAESMSLSKLREYTQYLLDNRLQANHFQVVYWQRIFQPLTTLVMILLAIPFVFAAPRTVSMGRRILLAIMMGFVFYILNAFFGAISIVFQLSPPVAAILPTILFALGGWMWVKWARL